MSCASPSRARRIGRRESGRTRTQSKRPAAATPAAEARADPRTNARPRRATAGRAGAARRGRPGASRRRQAPSRHQAVERAGDARRGASCSSISASRRSSPGAPDEAAADDPHIVGTPRYMAPEQGVGRITDRRVRLVQRGRRALRGAGRAAAVRGRGDRRARDEANARPDRPERVRGGRAAGARRALLRASQPRCAREADRSGDPAPPRGQRERSPRAAPPRCPTCASRSSAARTHLRALREAFEATRRGHSITVRIPGASGLGKSTLVHHFVDELEENAEAEVLRGRAYERESVPYKAVDAVVDALSRYMQRLADQGVSDRHAARRLGARAPLPGPAERARDLPGRPRRRSPIRRCCASEPSSRSAICSRRSRSDTRSSSSSTTCNGATATARPCSSS